MHNKFKTHCNQGHIFDKINTYLDKYGRRHCKTCRRDAMRRKNDYKGYGIQKDRTHCIHGHEFNEENTYITSKGHRRCNICAKLNARRYQNYQGNLPFGERTQCPKGHPYDEINTLYTINGHRRCKICLNYQNKLSPSQRTHCPIGHEYNKENTFISRVGGRICRICRRQHQRRYRHTKQFLDMNYSLKDQAITYQVFQNKCFKCGNSNRLVIDHHYPLIDGFGLSLTNAVILCKSCNSRKQDKWPCEYYSTLELQEVERLHLLAVKKIISLV